MYIPKIFYFSAPTLLLAGMSLASCSSEEIRTEPTPINPAGQTIELKFTVGANALTKAEDEPENKIESLNLVFFNSNNGSPLFLQNVEATLDGDNTYTANVSINPSHEPDLVIAFVNAESPISSSVFLPTTKVDNVKTTEGNLIMSTPRYFDSEGNDIYYQSFDYTSSTPIVLELERIAAKVAVTKNDDINASVDLKGKENEKVTLSLSLLNWGLTATDTETYLIRNIGEYSQLNSDFSSWTDWNKPIDKTLLWAYSANYDKEVSAFDIKLLKLEDGLIDFSNSCFAHESTRPLSIVEAKNAKPSVVIVGQYKKSGSETATTFYKFGSYYFEEEDLEPMMMKRAANCLGQNTNWTETNLSVELINGSDSPYVSLQCNDGVDITGLIKKDGTAFTTVDEVNQYLKSECGVAEMFKDGKCYFTVPIQHATVGEKYLYGLVRNHFYKLDIKSIKGIGTGIASEEQSIGEIDQIAENQESYEIKFSVNIRPWIDNTQEINIKKK